MRLVASILGFGLVLGGCGAAQTALDERLEGGLDGALEGARAHADDLIARGQELGQAFEWCAGAAELSQAVFAGDAEAAQLAAEELRGTAPEGLSGDLRVVAEAGARAQIGDPRVLMEDDVRDAARDVYAYAVDLCGLPGGEG